MVIRDVILYSSVDKYQITQYLIPEDCNLNFSYIFCSHSSVFVSDDKTGILSYSVSVQNTQSSQTETSPSYHL